MTYDSILVERDAPVATITMNRPEKRNALSSEMMRELNDALRALSAEPEVRAIVLAANGPAFSAGHDLRELVDGDINRYRAVFDLCTELMETIQVIPQPVIARVHRIATAAGCQLVATCDLAVAAEDAKFATPGVNIGLFCSTPMVALSRNVGNKRAMEMLLLGDLISAADAATYGLVNRVVPTDRVRAEAIALAAKIASKSPLTVAIGKKAFYAQAEMPLREAYDYAAKVMADNMMARDAEEGINAFLEKRPPEWKDR
jgi:enoyl-CoA hydratase/carnithine racemase